MNEKQLIDTDKIWNLLEGDWMTRIFGLLILLVILAFLTGNGKGLIQLITEFGHSVRGAIYLLYSWVTKRGNPEGFLEKARWPYDNIQIELHSPESISYEEEETNLFTDNHAFFFRSIRRMQFSGKKIIINLTRLQWISTHGRKLLCDIIRYHAKKNVIKLTIVFPSRMSESVKVLHDEVNHTAIETNAMSFAVKKESVKK